MRWWTELRRDAVGLRSRHVAPGLCSGARKVPAALRCAGRRSSRSARTSAKDSSGVEVRTLLLRQPLSTGVLAETIQRILAARNHGGKND